MSGNRLRYLFLVSLLTTLAVLYDFSMSAHSSSVSHSSTRRHIPIIGHRGIGMNPVAIPPIRENTIASFKHAKFQGADGCESDVQVTKDGVPIIWHDDMVEMKDLEPRFIKDMTINDIKEVNSNLKSLLRDGEPYPVPNESLQDEFQNPFPTLEDTLTVLYEQNLLFNLEIKFPGSTASTDNEVRRVVQAIVRCLESKSGASLRKSERVDIASIPLPQIVISSFDIRASSLVKEMLPAFPVYLISSYTLSPTPQPVISQATLSRLHGVVLETKQVIEHIIDIQKQAESNKLNLWTWGGDNDDNPDNIRQQEAVGGVSAFITNNITYARAALYRNEDEVQ